MNAPAGSILVVDDEPQNRKLLEALLRPLGYLTDCAANGADALASVGVRAPDLILLDVMMPGMDGYEVARQLKSDPGTAHIPIIMVTANSDRRDRLAGLEAGAEDFLCKPVDRAELWLRVRNLLRIKTHGDRLQEKGSLLEEEARARSAELYRLAHFDALTGLPNRALFLETLSAALVRTQASGWEVVVVAIGLDQFQKINDQHGRALGDELLLRLGERLVESMYLRDTVGHLGGDQFGLILPMQDGRNGALIVADKLRELLRRPFEVQGQALRLRASFGIAIHPSDAADAELLAKCVDTAMVQAKEAGGESFRFFTARMNTELMARLELEAALRRALELEEFELYYQPKVRLDTGRVAGLEALLRWHRPGHGLVGPGAFMPVLEETGLIVPVGRWVLAQACRQMQAWSTAAVGPVHVAVNVAARQLAEGDLIADLSAAISATGIDATLLQLELTESALMADTGRTHAILDAAKAMGIQISIDDFGTGYSSLAYLRRFQVDELKIDMAFIRDLATSTDAAAIVLAIIRMAESLKLETIAEGVETVEQLRFLREHGCKLVQGFYFSAPLPASEAARLLLEGMPLTRVAMR